LDTRRVANGSRVEMPNRLDQWRRHELHLLKNLALGTMGEHDVLVPVVELDLHEVARGLGDRDLHEYRHGMPAGRPPGGGE
jgi:hypothetical protein